LEVVLEKLDFFGDIVEPEIDEFEGAWRGRDVMPEEKPPFSKSEGVCCGRDVMSDE
jgi:hypothetical protein